MSRSRDRDVDDLVAAAAIMRGTRTRTVSFALLAVLAIYCIWISIQAASLAQRNAVLESYSNSVYEAAEKRIKEQSIRHEAELLDAEQRGRTEGSSLREKYQDERKDALSRAVVAESRLLELRKLIDPICSNVKSYEKAPISDYNEIKALCKTTKDGQRGRPGTRTGYFLRQARDKDRLFSSPT